MPASLAVDEAAGIVTGGVGQSGRNEDYLFNTVEHLQALGIRDHWLESVAERVALPVARQNRPPV